MLRYIAVGVVNTGVGLGTIYLGMYALGLSAEAANLVGYCVGIVTSFVLNKYWTFGNFAAARMQFVRFVGVMGVAYLVNLAAVEICMRLLGIAPYLAQPAGILPYTLVGYLGCRHFAFPVDA